ncbi:MAG TPA: ATP-binding protein [Devosiaceae bacterium]
MGKGIQPVSYRIEKGLHALLAAPAVLGLPSSAQAASFQSAQLAGTAPTAIALGAVAFGVAATFLAIRYRRQTEEIRKTADSSILELRAALDEFETVLAGMPEVTVIWHEPGGEPRVFGRIAEVLPLAKQARSVLDLASWLDDADANALARRLAELRVEGKGFDLTVTSRDGRSVRAAGRVLGAAAVLRLRMAKAGLAGSGDNLKPEDMADIGSAKAIFGLLSKPAWIRDANGRLVYGNPAYLHLARTLGKWEPGGELCEIFDAPARARHMAALEKAGGTVVIGGIKLPESGLSDIVMFTVDGGTAGYLRTQGTTASGDSANLGHLAGIIDALATPVAVFDARRQLIHFNRAYAKLWDLDPEWLRSGPDERAVLDRLRTQDQLPNEADYRAWRSAHLSAYSLSAPREESWYLPDGRTLNVIAAPASANGGVIYLFEDITERLALETRYNALIQVQRETINALSEGVAVFGTNGRLRLSNTQLSALWKLPINELGRNPHIDQIAEACASSLPEDGARIWRDLKRSIVDLDPSRPDSSGRLERSDGRLVDYAIVRLPDGQTMATFVDVTELANYQRILKERNDALITADRLKDAFVQNVSYEFRSPLTNIIGFADLLASGEAGPLTERQRAYTDYIRSSSTALGVLIDNILDLATVDAGVAELDIGEHDIGDLVEKARAGVAGAFAATDGGKPLNLAIDLAPDLPRLQADGTRVVQILYNLLSNAARFSEPGAEVRLSVKARGGHVLFVVEDEGAGISEDMKAAIFQRFEGQAVEGRQRGAGLGLAIVKTFVNLHGGTVRMEAREPHGTRVTVSLPAAHSAEIAGVAE